MDSNELRELGWNLAFEQQLTADEARDLQPVRVASHHGSCLVCLSGEGQMTLPIALTHGCGEVAVGDWLLLEPEARRGVRRLERESLLSRKAAGQRAETQFIAANLDTLFIVSSCNHDFNPSRLERYLTLALEAQINPVVVLTKTDLCEDWHAMRQQAVALKRDLVVEAVDARDSDQVKALGDWCGLGKTVALVGSSGVGKSTLAMSLGADKLDTRAIREDDSKGRHTTTARWIHRLGAGGLLIDTPGMRELQLANCESGVAEVFDDIVLLAEHCRFRDCSHQTEPGCAVQKAIEQEDLDPRRLRSYAKLLAEQARNSKSLSQRRYESRKQGKFYKTVLNSKRQRRQDEP